MDISDFEFPDFRRSCFKCGTSISDYEWGFYINARNPNRFECLCKSCEPEKNDVWIDGFHPFSKTFYADTYGRLEINYQRLWWSYRFKEILSRLPVISKDRFYSITVDSNDFADVMIKDLIAKKPIPSVTWAGFYLSLKKVTHRVRLFWNSFGTQLPHPYIWDCRLISHFDIRRILTISLRARDMYADTNYGYTFYPKYMYVARIDIEAWYVWIEKANWEY